MQEIGIVLGADVFLPFAVDAPEALLRILRRRERARILDVDRDVDRLAASTQSQPGPPMRKMRVETNHATRAAATAAAATAAVLYNVES
jgi:hypothetical protein